jgi:hypothetical protein
MKISHKTEGRKTKHNNTEIIKWTALSIYEVKEWQTEVLKKEIQK